MSSLTRALKTMFPMVAPFSRCLSQRAKNIIGIKSTGTYFLNKRNRQNDETTLLTASKTRLWENVNLKNTDQRWGSFKLVRFAECDTRGRVLRAGQVDGADGLEGLED